MEQTHAISTTRAMLNTKMERLSETVVESAMHHQDVGTVTKDIILLPLAVDTAKVIFKVFLYMFRFLFYFIISLKILNLFRYNKK
jgi:hypothetical protein